jgi:large subunit ribosomal protein L23
MEVIIKPIVTEKMTKAGDALNKYGFIVNKEVNKLQIKKAVEEMYNVSVETINTMRYGGAVKTRYTKGGVVTGRTNGYKKAIVTLSAGNKIDFYSNI